jgi:hypothetical protein
MHEYQRGQTGAAAAQKQKPVSEYLHDRTMEDQNQTWSSTMHAVPRASNPQKPISVFMITIS